MLSLARGKIRWDSLPDIEETSDSSNTHNFTKQYIKKVDKIRQKLTQPDQNGHYQPKKGYNRRKVNSLLGKKRPQNPDNFKTHKGIVPRLNQKEILYEVSPPSPKQMFLHTVKKVSEVQIFEHKMAETTATNQMNFCI